MAVGYRLRYSFSARSSSCRPFSDSTSSGGWRSLLSLSQLAVRTHSTKSDDESGTRRLGRPKVSARIASVRSGDRPATARRLWISHNVPQRAVPPAKERRTNPTPRSPSSVVRTETEGRTAQYDTVHPSVRGTVHFGTNRDPGSAARRPNQNSATVAAPFCVGRHRTTVQNSTK